MENFKMTGSDMNSLRDNLDTVSEKMDHSYETLKSLISQVNTDNAWTGKAEKTFLAYMDLMEQYHRKFYSEEEDCAVKQAVDALESHAVRVNSFYTDFEEYQNMRKIK